MAEDFTSIRRFLRTIFSLLSFFVLGLIVISKVFKVFPTIGVVEWIILGFVFVCATTFAILVSGVLEKRTKLNESQAEWGGVALVLVLCFAVARLSWGWISKFFG